MLGSVLPRAALVALVAAVTAAVFSLPAVAQDKETIVRALMPKPKMRGIAIEGGQQPAQAEAPSIDLHVPFEYDQSALTMSDAQLVVDALGAALKDPRLSNLKFQIIGHTDARGNDAHNDELSLRRANTVRARLTTYSNVDGSRLTVMGRGSRDLKDPNQREHGINRRVQIKTVDDKTS